MTDDRIHRTEFRNGYGEPRLAPRRLSEIGHLCSVILRPTTALPRQCGEMRLRIHKMHRRLFGEHGR